MPSKLQHSLLIGLSLVKLYQIFLIQSDMTKSFLAHDKNKQFANHSSLCSKVSRLVSILTSFFFTVIFAASGSLSMANLISGFFYNSDAEGCGAIRKTAPP